MSYRGVRPAALDAVHVKGAEAEAFVHDEFSAPAHLVGDGPLNKLRRHGHPGRVAGEQDGQGQKGHKKESVPQKGMTIGPGPGDSLRCCRAWLTACSTLEMQNFT